MINFEDLTWSKFLDIKGHTHALILRMSDNGITSERFDGLELLKSEEKDLYERAKPYFGGRKRPTLKTLALDLLAEVGKDFTDRSASNHLAAAREFRDGEVTFDEAAGNMWDTVYIGLETGRTGLLGKVTQRASPYVLRLSCLYALLDCSETVRREHLEAALALWKYAEDSARYIFGERSGDRVADDLRRALSEAEGDGLTRTDINNLFGRNVSAARISGALASLAKAGLAYSRSERRPDAKRPVERWFASVRNPVMPDEVNEFNEIDSTEGGLNSSNSCNSYPVEDSSAGVSGQL